MNNTTDTPRTDAASFSSRDPLELMKTSQQLERELNEAKAMVERLRELLEEAIPTLRKFHYANLSIHLRQCLNNIDPEKATLNTTNK